MLMPRKIYLHIKEAVNELKLSANAEKIRILDVEVFSSIK